MLSLLRPVPLRPCVPHGHVRSGAPPDAGATPLTSEFMGMASYAPACFHDLMDDDVESDGSSIGDVAPSHRPSWECAMADALGQPPVVAESLQTQTPPDPRAGTLALKREHSEELRQLQQNQPPPTPACSAHHTAPHAHNPASGARGHARQVPGERHPGSRPPGPTQHHGRGNDPPHVARAGQNIAAAAMLLCGLAEPNNP